MNVVDEGVLSYWIAVNTVSVIEDLDVEQSWWVFGVESDHVAVVLYCDLGSG